LNGRDKFKKKMAASFSEKAVGYDRRAGLQIVVAEWMRERLKEWLRPGLRLLDVGCGTGLLSLPLRAEDIRLHAVDMAPGMVAMVKEKTVGRPNIHPAVGDGECLPYSDDAFDLVISSLTYHWILNFEEAFREAFRVLKPGGFFSIALLGRGTLAELRDAYDGAVGENGGALPPLVAFPGTDAVRAAIREAGFTAASLESQNVVRTYPDFFDLLRSIKAIGAGNPYPGGAKSLRGKSALEAVRRRYHENSSDGDGVRATYEVIFCSGEKPDPVIVSGTSP
jgi:malonyl-CoA O-methyltransferase